MLEKEDLKTNDMIMINSCMSFDTKKTPIDHSILFRGTPLSAIKSSNEGF